MRRLYTDIIAPALVPLTRMTIRGMLIDPDALADKRRVAEGDKEEAKTVVLAAAAPYIPAIPDPQDPGCEEHPHPNKGTGVRKCERCTERRELFRDWKASKSVKKAKRLQDFDPSNKNHVRWLLAEELRLKWPAAGRTETGLVSVKVNYLEELLELRSTPEKHVPLIRTLVALAHVDARLRTFLSPPIGEDGCTHPNATLCGTSTLRLRSGAIKEDTPIEEDSYNGQNIPKDVRRIYRARPGHVLLAADAAQIEWVMTMIAARCPRAVEMYDKKVSVHIENLMDLAPVFGWTLTDHPKEQEEYGFSKSFTHASDYGEGTYNLARRMRVPKATADRGQKVYFDKWPEIPRWQEEVEQAVVDSRELRTVFGFRRRFFDVTRKKERGRWRLGLEGKQLKEALATGPQSMNATLHLIGINDLSEAGYPLYAVQHDEHVVEVPEGEAAAIEEDVKRVKFLLEREIPELEPLIGRKDWKPRVEVNIGRNWGPYHKHGEDGCKGETECSKEENPEGMKRIA